MSERSSSLPATRDKLPATRSSLAAVAALAVALAAAACSAEGGGGDDAMERGTTQAAARDDASSARLATATFDVEGMTCGGCALATEMAVKKLGGVESADAEYDEATDEGSCTVEYDPDRVTTARIGSAIEEAGFTPTLTSDSSTGPAPPAAEEAG